MQVQDSQRFVREGDDIVVREDISFAQAALGCEIEVVTLDSNEKLTVAPGVQHGHRLTLSGQGVPSLKRTRRGDFFVELAVKVPQKLSNEQRELLIKYAELAGEKVNEKGSGDGFFQRLFE